MALLAGAPFTQADQVTPTGELYLRNRSFVQALPLATASLQIFGASLGLRPVSLGLGVAPSHWRARSQELTLSLRALRGVA